MHEGRTVFAQLTYRESLRDIETCLRALGTKLYHSGIRSRVSRSTLADPSLHHNMSLNRREKAAGVAFGKLFC